MAGELQRQTILIVDDIPENIDVLVGVLKMDYNLKIAINGEKALKIANSQTDVPDANHRN